MTWCSHVNETIDFNEHNPLFEIIQTPSFQV